MFPTAVEKIDDGELSAGNYLCGEINAVGHFAVEGGAEEGDVLHGDAGELARVIGLELRLGMAAGEKRDDEDHA